MESGDSSEDLSNLEEELYSQVYHDSNTQLLSQNELSASDLYTSPSVSRYYQGANPKFRPKPKFNKDKKFKKNTENAQENADSVESLTNVQKVFVPYSSVLSFPLISPNEPVQENSKFAKKITSEDDELKIIEDKNKLNNKAAKEENSSFASPSRKIMKITFEKKSKTKATVVAKKQQKQKKKKEAAAELIEISSDDDDSSVIYVEAPAPPLIAVESSSDDDDVIKKKNKNRRGTSPSTSSIISDDFIVTSDKSRYTIPDKSVNNTPKANNHNMNEDNTSSDSIYNTKLKNSSSNKIPENTKTKATSSSSAKKVRQRSNSNDSNDSNKAEGHNESSSDGSSCIKSKEKRLRFETPNYNEKVFSTLISTAIVVQDSPNNKNTKHLKLIKEKPNSKVIEILDDDDDDDLSTNVGSRNNSKEPASDKNTKISKSKNKARPNPKPIEMSSLQRNDCDLILNVSSQDSSKESIEIDLSYEQLIDSPNANQHDPNFLDCEVGWNVEMKYFYNEYSFGRDFSLTNVKSFMPCDNWKISNVDRIKYSLDNDKKIRCRNCNELGHKAYNCYRPRKKTICFMCGETGHHAQRCPNAICLRCGKNNTFYSTMCASCAKLNKKRCPLCKNSFHDLEACPDKWRRYHSTTEDSATLDISYTRNERVFCSVCARPGHFAENCSYLYRNNGYITSSWFAVSNKPTYTTNCNFNFVKKNEQLLQLLTYIENYSFNLKLPSNCQLYSRFKQHFLSQIKGNDVVEEEIQQPQETHNNSDIENLDKNNEPEEFISISSNIIEESKVQIAKILLTTDHVRILDAKFGQEKLTKMCQEFKIELEFQLKATGKFMYINGSHKNQTSFYQELREFFYKSQLNKCEKVFATSTKLPKIISKIVIHLKTNLESIKKLGIREAKRVLNKLSQSELNFDYKMVLKHRKLLNILFMGSAELKDGSIHLKELRKIMVVLEKEIESGNGNSQVENCVREKLENHIKYIFSPMDHGNYFELYSNYKKALQKKTQMR